MEVLVLGVHSDVSGSRSHPHSLTQPPHLWGGEGVQPETQAAAPAPPREWAGAECLLRAESSLLGSLCGNIPNAVLEDTRA